MLDAFYSLLGIGRDYVFTLTDLVILFAALIVILFTLTSFLQLLASIFNLRK